MEQRGVDRALREALCRTAGRQRADFQRQAPERLRRLAQVQPRAVREMVSQEHRADWRCRAHRAFRHRFRHQAGHGRRHGAGARAHDPQRRRGKTLYSLYQEEREIEALKLQSAARNRMEWFEEVERYVHLEPEQFAYSLLTGSQRIGHANLKLRDSRYVERVEKWFAGRSGVDHSLPPMFTPISVRGVTLKNRVICLPDGHVHGGGWRAQRFSSGASAQRARWAARPWSSRR